MTDEKRRSELREEIKILNELLKVAKDLKNKELEGTAYGGLGSCYSSLGQNNKAVENYELQLNIAKQTGDKASEGSAYGNLGICCRLLGHHEKAIEHHELHLKIARQIADQEQERIASEGLGICHYNLGHYHKAMDHFKEVLSIEDKIGEGKIHGNLGKCCFQLGQYHNAMKHLEKELAFAKQFRDKAREGSAYGSLGLCYYCLSQYELAIEYQEKALKISKQIENKEDERNAHSGLGNCYLALGRNAKAMEHHKENLTIAKQVKDKIAEGQAYGNLGNCYFKLCQYDEAIKHHQMQLNIVKKVGEKRGECLSRQNLGICFMSLGLYDKAREHLEMARNIAEETRDKVNQEPVYTNIGTLCMYLGQYQEGVRHFEMALDIAKQIGDKAGEGSISGDLGQCYDILGKYDKALEYHKLQLNIAQTIGDKAGEGKAYACLGNCHESFGHYDEATKCHEMALKIMKEINHKAGEANACGNLGNYYRVLGQNEKALEHLKMNLNIAKEIGDSKGEADACANICYYYCALGQSDKAEQYCNRSMQCYEKLFENSPKQDHCKVSIRDTFIKIHTRLIELLLSQDKRGEALVIAERGRSRALLELMFTSHPTRCADVTETRVSDLPEIREVVKVLGSTVLFFTLLSREICTWAIQPNGVVALKETFFEVSSPEVKNYCLTKNVEEFHSLINKTREIIRSSTTVHCEDRSLAFLYPEKVRKETKNKPRTASPSMSLPADLPVSQQGSYHDCTVYRAALHTSTSSTTPAGTERSPNQVELQEPQLEYLLKELYQSVLQPVRQFVEGSQAVVVPDGPLPLIPFAALLDENSQYVAETLQVRLIPSLTAAKMIKERPQEPEGQGSPLIVGDPDVGEIKMGEETTRVPRLPHANEEAKMVGELLNAQPLTGEKATKKNFLEKVENANLIHIAAHGDMTRGEILLAPSPGSDTGNLEDAMLKISDLEDKRMTAKLVVLSCCHSGHGEVRAEGVIGIARAFLGAGARAVVVSLWAIDDKATLYFMREFYEHLVIGERANEAIHRAMKTMRETEEFRHPRYWSPFVLIGEDAIPFAVHSDDPDFWACGIF